MKLVDQPMDDWREQNGRQADEHQPAEQRVATREQFSGHRLRRFQRAHPRKNHRGVDEGVKPVELFKEMIAGHADPERNHYQSSAQQTALGHPQVKRLARQNRAGAMLKHRAMMFGQRKFSSAVLQHVSPLARAFVPPAGN
jgi:hypothetical protein